MGEGNEMDASRNLTWKMNSTEPVLSSASQKPGWKATWAAGGRLCTGWEMVAGRVLLAGSEMGLYLRRILINDLQEVMSRTLIKCAHVAKWEIGGENTIGGHIISRYCFSASVIWPVSSGLTLCPPALFLLFWSPTRFSLGATGAVSSEQAHKSPCQTPGCVHVATSSLMCWKGKPAKINIDLGE